MKINIAIIFGAIVLLLLIAFIILIARGKFSLKDGMGFFLGIFLILAGFTLVIYMVAVYYEWYLFF